MDTFTVFLIGRNKTDENAIHYKPGYPYLTFVSGYARCEITLTGGAAILMRAFKKSAGGGRAAYDLAGVLADYLTEHPHETDKPLAVEKFLIPLLRKMFNTRTPYFEGRPAY